MFDLSGKTAFVTGAASGIGLAISHLFEKQGAFVLAFDCDEEGLAKLATQHPNMLCVAGDVTQADQVKSAMETLLEHRGRFDILVNNAGVAHVGRLDNTSAEDFDRIFQINVAGVFVCSKLAIKHMLDAKGGVILNLASIASLIGLEDRFAYSMSKGAVLSMTRSIATDYVKRNIRCNCLCPARIHTPFVDQFIARNYPGREHEIFEKLSQSQPIGRMGTPEEVAKLALYLCSDDAAFVTGAAFPIDGAYTAV